MTALVLDTNIVLDVFVFADQAAKPVLPALTEGRLRWVATSAMRDELARVLDYSQIVPRLAFYELVAGVVLAAFDRHAQKFIDLAVARQALLLSKDRAVLTMKKRLAAWSVQTRTAFEPVCLST